MKKIIKKLKKNIFIQFLLAIISCAYILFVRISSRINITNFDIPKKFWKDNNSFILVFWHSQLMMISFTWSSEKKINILASKHSDGRFGSIVGSFFKLRNIPHSSKNFNSSIKNIFKLIKNNECIGITPDGPRGPNQKVGEGTIKLASLLGIPIITCGFWSSKNIKLKSWDNFLITLPFSKCFFVWSKPIHIKKNLSKIELNKLQIMLEKQLNKNIEIAKNKAR